MKTTKREAATQLWDLEKFTYDQLELLLEGCATCLRTNHNLSTTIEAADYLELFEEEFYKSIDSSPYNQRRIDLVEVIAQIAERLWQAEKESASW